MLLTDIIICTLYYTWYWCLSSKCWDTAGYLGKSLDEELSKISDQSMFFEGEMFCLTKGLKMYKLVESWQKGNKYQTTPQSWPIKVDWYKWGRNGEVIHERVKFQHEPEFVRCSNELEIKIKVTTTDQWLFDAFSFYPNEKIDHEEDIECEIYLLGGILCPGYAGLHSIATNHLFHSVQI